MAYQDPVKVFGTMWYQGDPAAIKDIECDRRTVKRALGLVRGTTEDQVRKARDSVCTTIRGNRSTRRVYWSAGLDSKLFNIHQRHFILEEIELPDGRRFSYNARSGSVCRIYPDAPRQLSILDQPHQEAPVPTERSPLAEFNAKVAEIVDSTIPITPETLVDTETSGEEVDEPTELFPELFYTASSKAMDDADFICGCVPFPVTIS